MACPETPGVSMTTGRHRSCDALEGAKPVIVMVINQVLCGGISIFYMLAVKDGMNFRIVIAYRALFGMALMVPLTLVIERNKRPKLTWTVLLQAFCCGLLGGTLGQNLYLASIAMTSATYGAAMNNLIPAFTFVFAVFLGLEKLRIKSAEGMAKVIGTLLGIGGAMVLTFYKGVQIHIWSTRGIVHEGGGSGSGSSHAHSSRQFVGSLLAVGSCISYAASLILQAKLAKRYPCHVSSTAMILTMSAVQGVVVALCEGRGSSEWKLGWNIRLLAVSYLGTVGSGICMMLSTWCMNKRGPLFGAVFNPLSLVFVAIVGSFLFGEKLYLGSLVGAVLIIGGLYLVVRGKNKEMKMVGNLPTKICETSSQSMAKMVENLASSNLEHDRDRITVEGDNPSMASNRSCAVKP